MAKSKKIKTTVICERCCNKYKKIPKYKVDELGYKMCKHINHTQSKDSNGILDIWAVI